MEKPKGDVTLDTLAVMIKSGFDDVHTRIDKFEGRVDASFASMERRLDDLADKIGDHEVRITKLEEPALS